MASSNPLCAQIDMLSLARHHSAFTLAPLVNISSHLAGGNAPGQDLLTWNFSVGRIFSYNPIVGAFDYGGVTFGGPLYANASVSSPRRLLRRGGRYYVLYGAYPNRNGYESGHGAEGVAWSDDGVSQWTRESPVVPILSVEGAAAWEKDVVYQPNLVYVNVLLLPCMHTPTRRTGRGGTAAQKAPANPAPPRAPPPSAALTACGTIRWLCLWLSAGMPTIRCTISTTHTVPTNMASLQRRVVSPPSTPLCSRASTMQRTGMSLQQFHTTTP